MPSRSSWGDRRDARPRKWGIRQVTFKIRCCSKFVSVGVEFGLRWVRNDTLACPQRRCLQTLIFAFHLAYAACLRAPCAYALDVDGRTVTQFMFYYTYPSEQPFAIQPLLPFCRQCGASLSAQHEASTQPLWSEPNLFFNSSDEGSRSRRHVATSRAVGTRSFPVLGSARL